MAESDKPWRIWANALVPSVDVYRRIIQDHNVNVRTAATWTAATDLGAWTIRIIGLTLAGTMDVRTIRFLIYSTPIVIVATVVMLMALAAIGNWIGKELGGVGSYPELLYAYAALYAPMTVIVILANTANIASDVVLDIDTSVLLDTVALLVIPYRVLLVLCATKAVHQLKWSKTFLTALPILVLETLILLVAIFLFG